MRTIVVLVLAWLIVPLAGSLSAIKDIDAGTWIFLILSGLATGASWLCYFKALKVGDINKVVPVDKSSTVLTMLLAIIFLGEQVNAWVLAAMVGIGVGTLLMIERKTDVGEVSEKHGWSWLLYASGAAIFAALTAILGKIGIEGVESTLGTAIRTCVVLVRAWLIVFIQRTHKQIFTVDKRSWLFLILSGLTTGLSWLCYFRALQDGPASVVVPIDKLSILVSLAFGAIVFREKLSKKASLGLALIVVGTLALVVKQ
nr:EamA family transporter [Corynebacterium suranareeae]